MNSVSEKAFSAGIISRRSLAKGLCSETARWQGLSSRKRSMPRLTPTVLTVMRLGLHAHPSLCMSSSVTFSTVSRLSKGSPCPMNTMFVSLSLSGREYIWFIMSVAVRCPWKPCLPVMQNLHPMRHPTWQLTHRVPRSLSGMKTLSTVCPDRVGKRYLAVPSTLRCASTAGISPMQYCSASRVRAFWEMFVIS